MRGGGGMREKKKVIIYGSFKGDYIKMCDTVPLGAA